MGSREREKVGREEVAGLRCARRSCGELRGAMEWITGRGRLLVKVIENMVRRRGVWGRL